MKSTASPGRWTGLLVSGLLLLTAVFLGLLIGAEQHVLVVLFMLLLLSLPMFYLAVFGYADQRAMVLCGGFLLMLFAQTLQSRGIPAGYLLEMVIFLFMLSSLREVLRVARSDATLRWVIAFFLMYFALALASTLLGRSHWRGAVWQLQYNLKLPLMFALGMLLVAPDQAQAMLRRFVAWSWLFFLPFLVFELAAYGAFMKVFGHAHNYHPNVLLPFMHGLRGPFAHAGYLSLISGLLASGAVAFWLQGLGRRWLGCAAIYTAFAVCAGQRQELMALVLVFLLFALIQGRKQTGWLAVGAMAGLACLLMAALVMEHNPFGDLMRQWGGGRASDLSERAVLTEGGMRVAEQYFPLGSGLGTYGGAGAQRFDQSLFVDLGFNRYWWFRQRIFLVDTYWPSVAAEAGYPAMLLLAAAFVLMWCVLLWRSVRVDASLRPLLLTGLAALTLQLANSPTSAVLTDPRGAFVFWLLIGCAWRASVVYRAPSVELIRHNRPVDFSVRYLSS
jgi:hypothetical protein